MIRITGSGQMIGSGPIAFADTYLERTREALGQIFRRRAMTPDGRKLRICGDLVSPAGTAYTAATIEFRFLGDCIVYDVDGRIAPGPRTWAGIALALALLIAEAWLLPRSAEIIVAATITKWLGLAATAWYLVTFVLFALNTRRRLLSEMSAQPSSGTPEDHWIRQLGQARKRVEIRPSLWL
ncbi:MAG: hypothetical protein ACOYLQ_20365 [Hyphomicrobiaceae bacterium]